MAINSCLLDFCLNGSKVTAIVRPTQHAQRCCDLRTLATRDIQLKQLSANHTVPVWTQTKVCVPVSQLVQAWSTSCSVNSIECTNHEHSKDIECEVNSHYSNEDDKTSYKNSEVETFNHINTANCNVARCNGSNGIDTISAEDTMKLRNSKKTRRNTVKVSERIQLKVNYKKRSGRRCPQPGVAQDKPVAQDIPVAQDTVDAARHNVQLPDIKPLSEDSSKPTVSWIQAKSVARLTAPSVMTCNVDKSASTSSPALPLRPCQTSVTTLCPDICALTASAMLTTKGRADGTSPPRKLMTQQGGGSKSKVTKVFWSEAQTLNLNQLGMSFPGAPPCTPTPELTQHYEYVASMTDIRAQRALRAHLEAIDMIQKRKAERERELKHKREKIYQKTLQIETKKKQRSQIYALNKVMTEMEHRLFKEFCKQKTTVA